MSFDDSFAAVVGIEGNDTDDPRDPGGYTRFGMSQRANPDIDVRSLTLPAAKQRYFDRYWTPAGCDSLPALAARCVFDCAVNQGVPTAVKLAQTACGLGADGFMGPNTRLAFSRVKTEHLAVFMGLRAQRYAHTQNVETDGLGWFSRLFRISLPETL